jgi:hypothetical protein
MVRHGVISAEPGCWRDVFLYGDVAVRVMFAGNASSCSRSNQLFPDYKINVHLCPKRYNPKRQETGAKTMSAQPQYITDSNGQKLSVILPMADYLELLEDLEDLATIAERKDEGTIPLEDVLKELNL